MQSQTFPTNCGIQLLTDFGNTRTAIDSRKYTTEEVEKFIKDMTKFPYGRAISMITLNNEQKDLLHDVVISCNFELLNEKGYYHPAHKTEIFIYVKRNFEFDPETGKHTAL